MSTSVSYHCDCGAEYEVRPVTCACGRKFAGAKGNSVIRIEMTTDKDGGVFVESSIVEPPRRRKRR